MAWLNEVRYGDLPTWLTMVATIAAVIAAVRAGRWAKDIVEIERVRDKRHELEVRARQASQIAAWASPTVTKPERREGALLFWASTGVSVSGLIANRSNQPIYKVTLEWYKEGELIHKSSKPVVAPGDVALCALEPSQVLAIADIPEEQRGSTAYDYGSAVTLSELAVTKLLLAVRFTDSANRKWYRNCEGILSQVSASHSKS